MPDSGHGPPALIDETMPTVALVPDDEVTDRNVAAVRQILARRGPVVAVTHPGVAVGDATHTITVPRVERELVRSS